MDQNNHAIAKNYEDVLNRFKNACNQLITINDEINKIIFETFPQAFDEEKKEIKHEVVTPLIRLFGFYEITLENLDKFFKFMKKNKQIPSYHFKLFINKNVIGGFEGIKKQIRKELASAKPPA